jgi:hypothetical protein
VPAHQQILVGAPATLTVRFAGSDGEPADPGVVTIGIVRGDGTEVVAAGTAASGSGTAARTYSLAAEHTDSLDLLTATWTSTTHGARTTVVEIVGGYWFSIDEARSIDEKLFDADKYPNDRIIAVRAEVEAEFESVTNQAWVPRYKRVRVTSTGSKLVLPDVQIRRVRSVWSYTDPSTYTVFTADELDAVEVTEWGTLAVRPWDSWYGYPSAYVVEYEHGHDAPYPDLREAAVTRLRHRLNSFRSGIPDRATSMSTDAGQTYNLATPGQSGVHTGIPQVDEVLERYRFVVAGIA